MVSQPRKTTMTSSLLRNSNITYKLQFKDLWLSRSKGTGNTKWLTDDASLKNVHQEHSCNFEDMPQMTGSLIS
jgi:hypothetical protein